jgi:hypothetical protein
MNRWFARYPDDHRTALRGRLTSGDNFDFHSAWFELYLRELHRRLGFEVTVEPVLSGVSTRPDFRLMRGRERLLIEATIVGDREQAGRAARIARVVAAVNRTRNPDFRFLFEILSEGQDSPPMREVRQRLERWLAGLDWSDEREKQERHFSFATMPGRTERVGDWAFSFRAWPRKSEDRGRPGAAIVAGPSDGGTFDHGGTVLDRLTEKATKYGTPEDPVIIAVRIDRLSTPAEDVKVALYGPVAERTALFRHESGRPRNRHIAGVLVWDLELRPWSVARQTPVLWRHPEPLNELPGDLPWASVELDANDVVRFRPGSFDPVETLDLPEATELDAARDWPGRPEFHARD